MDRVPQSLSNGHFDSDHYDSDVETELYSQIYHQKDVRAETRATAVSSAIPSQATRPSAKTIDYVTLSSDSESEPSKSEIVGLKRKRPPSPSDDESDDEIVLLPQFSFDESSLIVPSVTANGIESDGRALTRRSSHVSKALGGFLAKCQPKFVPGGFLETVSRPVSVELLNLLPGNNNRFKRIRLDPGEDPALWRVDEADTAAYKSKGRDRYFRGKKETICLNCKRFTDHVARTCPKPRAPPVCFVCGQTRHLGQSCRKQICGKCFQTGHVATSCIVTVNQICDICQLVGHLSNQCPNRWRKFCTTTDPLVTDPNPVIVQNRRTCCSNCASTSHFAFDCPDRKSDMYPHSSPFLTKISSAPIANASRRSCTATRSNPFPSSSSFSAPAALANFSPNPFEGLRVHQNPRFSAKPVAGVSYRASDAELRAAYPISTVTRKQSIKSARRAEARANRAKNKKKQKKAANSQFANKAKMPIGGPKVPEAKKGPNIHQPVSRGQRKENVFMCPDGQARTWKEMWSVPTASRSSNVSIALPPPPPPSFFVKQEVKREQD